MCFFSPWEPLGIITKHLTEKLSILDEFLLHLTRPKSSGLHVCRCTRCHNFGRLYICKGTLYINVREYRRGKQKRTIQRNWKHRIHKTKKTKQKHNSICVGHHYRQTNTNNVNETRALLQTTGDIDELNIVLMRKLQQISQRGTQNAKDIQ